MAILVMAVLVGAIFIESSQRRRAFVVRVEGDDPSIEWIFNVRDMCAELSRRGNTARTLATYDLRRRRDGAWEVRRDADIRVDTHQKLFFATTGLPDGESAPESMRTWSLCTEPARRAIEAAHVRYNAG